MCCWFKATDPSTAVRDYFIELKRKTCAVCSQLQMGMTFHLSLLAPVSVSRSLSLDPDDCLPFMAPATARFCGELATNCSEISTVCCLWIEPSLHLQIPSDRLFSSLFQSHFSLVLSRNIVETLSCQCIPLYWTLVHAPLFWPLTLSLATVTLEVIPTALHLHIWMILKQSWFIL